MINLTFRKTIKFYDDINYFHMEGNWTTVTLKMNLLFEGDSVLFLLWNGNNVILPFFKGIVYIYIYIYIYTLSVEIFRWWKFSSVEMFRRWKCFAGGNFSSVEMFRRWKCFVGGNFVTWPNFRHFPPTKFSPIRYNIYYFFCLVCVIQPMWISRLLSH